MIAKVKERTEIFEGLPEGCKAIPLTQGKHAIVDAADYDWLMQWNWRYHWTGYAVRTESIGDASISFRPRKMILMHRRILEAPKGMDCDHIDHNRLNNSRSNLRLATRAQNMQNASKQKRKLSSVHKGVSWIVAHGKWQARIKANKKLVHIGYFETEIEAAIAYNNHAAAYFGDFAVINSIEGQKP